MSQSDVKSKHIIFGALLLLLVLYSLYQARFIILGPRLWIDTPQNGEVLDSQVLEITGRAHNVAWIELNDRQIFTDEEGNWGEKLLVATGTSIMTIKARDRYGRERVKSVEVMLK